MHFQNEFYQVMTRLKTNSRAASTPDDARIMEMVNELLVSKSTTTKPVVTYKSMPDLVRLLLLIKVSIN